MIDFVAKIVRNVDSDCVSEFCSKDRCSVSMNGVPSNRAIIDLDHNTFLNRYGQKKCDYLVVSQEAASVWVSPIELKSGDFEPSSVIKQLQAGADQAQLLLADCHSFHLVPVVAHRRKKRLHPKDVQLLRTARIRLRGKTRQAILIRCGDRLGSVLTKK